MVAGNVARIELRLIGLYVVGCSSGCSGSTMRCDAVHTSASLAFHMGQFFITGFMLKDIIIFYIVFIINDIEAP